jgi:tetratricopeptide (TPR) repeat protein
MSELNLVEETELFDSLTLLEKNYYLIQRDGEIDRSDIVLDLYKFIKNFYREFIYSQIDPGKRRLIHKKIADLLEKLYDGETDSIASKLIYHNRESHNFERSIHYCINGAKYEQMNYGWIEAEKMCKEGLSLCEKIKEEKGRWRLTFELLKISAKGLYICGNVDLAHSRYTEIANIIPSINVSLEENLEFLLDFIDACEDSNRISEAIIYIKKVEEIIENSNYSGKYKNQFVIYKSWEYIRTGQNKKAVEILKGLLDDIDENDQNFWILSLAYNGLGIATSNLGDPSSIDYLRKAVFYGEKLGTDKRQGIALLNLADDLLYYNKVVEASAYNDKALLLVRKIGDRDGEAYGLANKGRIELMYKKPESAISFLNDCMVILDEIGSAWNKSFVLSDLAVSYSFLGNQAIALEKIDLADRYIENDPFRLLYVVRSKAQLLCNLGKPLEGLDLFRKALEICDQSDDIYFKYETLSDYADELEKIGDFTQAQKIRSEIPKNFNL